MSPTCTCGQVLNDLMKTDFGSTDSQPTPWAFSTILIRFECIIENGSCPMTHLRWINTWIHLNWYTNHATQSFYSSVMLHATVKPEDECTVQRLDYDRTNLLKTIHPRQSLWIEKSSKNVILGVKNSVKGRIEMYLRSFQMRLISRSIKDMLYFSVDGLATN